MRQTCKFCGKAFTPGNGHRDMCSDACAKASNSLNQAKYQRNRRRREREAKMVERVCPSCGKSFSTSSRKKAYCSPACQAAYKKTRRSMEKRESKRKLTVNICLVCGAEFTGRPGALYCSKACSCVAYRRHAHEKRLANVPVVACAHCGTEFKQFRKDKKFCSDACRLASRNVRRRVEPKKEGAITDAQRRQVEEDMKIVYPAVRYRRSLAWTPAMHSYARRIYMESHPLRAGNCTVNH